MVACGKVGDNKEKVIVMDKSKKGGCISSFIFFTIWFMALLIPIVIGTYMMISRNDSLIERLVRLSNLQNVQNDALDTLEMENNEYLIFVGCYRCQNIPSDDSNIVQYVEICQFLRVTTREEIRQDTNSTEDKISDNPPDAAKSDLHSGRNLLNHQGVIAESTIDTDDLEFKTDDLEFKADDLEFKADDLEFKADDLEFKADYLDSKADDLEFKADDLDSKADDIEFKADDLDSKTDDLEYKADDLIDQEFKKLFETFKNQMDNENDVTLNSGEVFNDKTPSPHHIRVRNTKLNKEQLVSKIRNNPEDGDFQISSSFEQHHSEEFFSDGKPEDHGSESPIEATKSKLDQLVKMQKIIEQILKKLDTNQVVAQYKMPNLQHDFNSMASKQINSMARIKDAEMVPTVETTKSDISIQHLIKNILKQFLSTLMNNRQNSKIETKTKRELNSEEAFNVRPTTHTIPKLVNNQGYSKNPNVEIVSQNILADHLNSTKQFPENIFNYQPTNGEELNVTNMSLKGKGTAKWIVKYFQPFSYTNPKFANDQESEKDSKSDEMLWSTFTTENMTVIDPTKHFPVNILGNPQLNGNEGNVTKMESRSLDNSSEILQAAELSLPTYRKGMNDQLSKNNSKNVDVSKPSTIDNIEISLEFLIKQEVNNNEHAMGKELNTAKFTEILKTVEPTSYTDLQQINNQVKDYLNITDGINPFSEQMSSIQQMDSKEANATIIELRSVGNASKILNVGESFSPMAMNDQVSEKYSILYDTSEAAVSTDNLKIAEDVKPFPKKLLIKREVNNNENATKNKVKTQDLIYTFVESTPNTSLLLKAMNEEVLVPNGRPIFQPINSNAHLNITDGIRHFSSKILSNQDMNTKEGNRPTTELKHIDNTSEILKVRESSLQPMLMKDEAGVSDSKPDGVGEPNITTDNFKISGDTEATSYIGGKLMRNTDKKYRSGTSSIVSPLIEGDKNIPISNANESLDETVNDSNLSSNFESRIMAAHKKENHSIDQDIITRISTSNVGFINGTHSADITGFLELKTDKDVKLIPILNADERLDDVVSENDPIPKFEPEMMAEDKKEQNSNDPADIPVILAGKGRFLRPMNSADIWEYFDPRTEENDSCILIFNLKEFDESLDEVLKASETLDETGSNLTSSFNFKRENMTDGEIEDFNNRTIHPMISVNGSGILYPETEEIEDDVLLSDKDEYLFKNHGPNLTSYLEAMESSMEYSDDADVRRTISGGIGGFMGLLF